MATRKKKPGAKKSTAKKPSGKKRSKAKAGSKTGSEEQEWGSAKKERSGRYHFPGISPRAYEHPTDRAALAALRAVPGFDMALRTLFGSFGDRSIRLAFLGSAVRVGTLQFPKLHRMHRRACRILDMEPPELFVSQTPLVNAGAIGIDKPFVVLNSGLVSLLDEDELQAVIGHELGHILSGHALYKTMLAILLRLGWAAGAIPLGRTALFAVTAALLEWDRRSELSGDRAGMLVAQDAEVVMRLNMKMAGGGHTDQMNLGEFLVQAEEYNAGGSVMDSVMKLVNLMGVTHPFPVLRIAELKKWIDEGGYDEILEDGYPLRNAAPSSILDEVISSTESYKKDFESSKDPLATMLRDLARQAKGASDVLFDLIRPDAGADEEEEG